MPRVLVLLAPGFEETEAIMPVDFLRRAGASVQLTSITSNAIVSGAHHISVQADLLLSQNYANADMVVLPGGMPGAENLANSPLVIELLNDVYAKGGTIAALCAAPAYVLPKTQFFAQQPFTCHPSVASLVNSYEGYEDNRLVITEQLITSQGPGTTATFTQALIEHFFGPAHAKALMRNALFNV